MARTFAFLVLFAAASVAGAVPADLAKPGKFPVGVATIQSFDTARNRILTSELWYPAKATGRDATIRKGQFPLVMMAHGYCGSRLNYEYLTTHLASHGFIVAAPDFAGLTHADCDPGPPTGTSADQPYDLSFVCRDLHNVSGRQADWAKHVRGSGDDLGIGSLWVDSNGGHELLADKISHSGAGRPGDSASRSGPRILCP